MCPTFLKKSFRKEDSEASKRVGGCAAAAAVISLDAFCKPYKVLHTKKSIATKLTASNDSI